MKVAWISPLPPAPTGVAEYSARLSIELARYIEIETFDRPCDRSLTGYDTCVYQLGNNSLHGPTYDAALNVPGVVVLHDAVLHHFILERLSKEEYIEEFVFNYGEWLRDYAAELWRERAVSASQERYFRYPFIRRIAECSRILVVHNKRACCVVQAEITDGKGGPAKVVEIPHYVELPSLPGVREREYFREKLAIPQEEIVISTFGYLRPSKRIHSIIEAAKMLNVPYRILLVGDFISKQYEAAISAEIGVMPVMRIPYVSEKEFWGLVAISDIGINLRYPSAGETSAIALKLMAAGKPVVVSAGEEVERFPSDSVIRVDPGEAEIEMLAHYLRVLTTNREMREVFGQNAAHYVAERHKIGSIAKQYMNVISRAVES